MPDILALRDERLELGITQMDVAEAVGVHVSTVNRWETLQCNPTRRHLCAYMYAVKVWARNSGQRERKYLPLPREAADVPFVSEIEALDLRARLRRMGLTDLDVAALWNVKRSTAGGKLNGWCRMRVNPAVCSATMKRAFPRCASRLRRAKPSQFPPKEKISFIPFR